eukprot:TRINITY_DN50956_c0_g1_i1.p1 TRINITY_DN50956_c0_g1~~TRINITY_DN50956_c0_g1_i1.p1  ORF type:complete len:469 (+),score=171.76 TRINITY_DN50956_c0_g1_i1:85-1407(+)
MAGNSSNMVDLAPLIEEPSPAPTLNFEYVYDRSILMETMLIGAAGFHVASLIMRHILRRFMPNYRGAHGDFLKLPVERQHVTSQRLIDALSYVFVLFSGAQILVDKIRYGTWNTWFMFQLAQWILPWMAGMYIPHLLTRAPGTKAGFNDAMFWLHHLATWGCVSYVIGTCDSCTICDLDRPEVNAVWWVGVTNMTFDEATSIGFNLLAFLYTAVRRPSVKLAYFYYGTWFWCLFFHTSAYVTSFTAYGFYVWDLPNWFRFYVYLPWICLVLFGHLHTHKVYMHMTSRFLAKAKVADAEARLKELGEVAAVQSPCSARRTSIKAEGIKQELQGLEAQLEETATAAISDVAMSPRNDMQAHRRRSLDPEKLRQRLEQLDRVTLVRYAEGAGIPEGQVSELDREQLLELILAAAFATPFQSGEGTASDRVPQQLVPQEHAALG